MNMNLGLPSTASRPTFTLPSISSTSSSLANTDHTFPQVQMSTTLNLGPASSSPDEIPGLGPSISNSANLKSEPDSTQEEVTWILDFTNNGRTPGLVMSQSRMREVQLVINPSSAVEDMMYSPPATGFGSWVDLLVRHNIL